ncbi:1-phosphofructokinase [Stackebrandtia nassauensis]|uniref:1-phosphofructokinase n=1 Tax=Stackebrandtia nassauensis (strain DSM 44728 / CIP 108903 / NRRL B-16338 / NBRC 102104 / LLR-40K-21) TaxID=446470 RepID=D3Q1W9_STANL|nr:1-phosphofructokinase [Stackebrandtia nassauensis]ADD41836.1 1-phosphofructokinase [Stackebrandtia nassauensis DSM 44728]
MIVTVTLNPSVDRTLEIETLTHGRVNRAAHTHLDPGGKGVNVSRALVANGVDTRAILPCGGDEGDQLVRLLRGEGVRLTAVPIDGRTRSNVTLVEPDGTVTKINESGPELAETELTVVAATVRAAAEDAEWVVVSGTVPPGVTPEAFTEFCGELVSGGAKLAVDTSGEPLRAAARAGAALVKPNRHELSDVTGVALDSVTDVVNAAETLRRWGAGSVLASLGSKGAVLVDADGVLIGEPPSVVTRSAVGAGDAMLAGFLAAGAAGAKALTEALAWGSAAASLPGSRMPFPADLNRHGVRISPGDLTPLSHMDS